jgi:hypothetical protein
MNERSPKPDRQVCSACRGSRGLLLKSPLCAGALGWKPKSSSNRECGGAVVLLVHARYI